MINIRYHIFSLIAVFAALAIGLTIGTAVVRGPLVDNLRQNLDRVEARNDTVRAENDRLKSALDESMALDAGGGALLAGRAQGTLVVLVVETGIDGEALNGIVNAFEDGGARIVGRVVVDVDPGDVGGQIASGLRFVRALINGASTSAPVEAATLLRDYLASVLATGKVELKNLDEQPILVASDLRVVVVGDRNNGNGDWSPFVTGLEAGFSTDLSGPLPVVAEIDDLDPVNDDTLDPSVVAAVRKDRDRRVEVSTVDNASHFVGWAALVLAAENSLSRVATHLGVHDGSEGLLPAIK